MCRVCSKLTKKTTNFIDVNYVTQCLYCLLLTDFTHCFGVFIVVFEYINAGRDLSLFILIRWAKFHAIRYDRSSIKMMKNSKYGWLYFCMTKTLTLNMRNRFGWLGTVTTLWGSLNHLISHIFFNTFLIGYQHSTCHCGIPHSSSATVNLRFPCMLSTTTAT